MNGYFQLEVQSKGIYMTMIPPKDGGTHCTMEDVVNFLEHHGITGYNTVELKKLVNSRSGSMFLNSMWMPTLGEDVLVKISDDKMTATAVFYPPFVGGKKIDKDTIESILASKGIKVGIQQDVIDKFLAEREYCTPYVVALGEEPGQGTDASIEYFFDTELCAKPQLNEDGSVDFHKLNSISHVQKGDVLATLTPEKRGTPGTNVLGVPVPAKDVKKKKLSFGKNISYTDDSKLSIMSDVDGHVSLINDQVFVSDTYQIMTDVDAGTGDIEYKGNIEVKGNVRSGFALKATGDIIVNGVVEGATLIADGDIVLSRGIQGMGKGRLVAQGNIVTKFVENATVKAGGNVTAEAILHSRVSAKEKVLVTGKKGFITGGKVSALHCVEAKTIGSNMGAETTISVGTDPEEREREYQCQQEMTQLRKDITRIEPVVKKMTARLASGEKLTEDQKQQTKTMVTQYREYKKKYDELEKELMERLEAEQMEKGANVRVNGKIYPGVKIMISDHMYIVRESVKYCRFDLQGMDVKIGAL